jgi:hypothetical protein
LPPQGRHRFPILSFEKPFRTERELFIAPDDEIRTAFRDTSFPRLQDETIHIIERSTQPAIGQDASQAGDRQQENHQQDHDGNYNLDQSETIPAPHLKMLRAQPQITTKGLVSAACRGARTRRQIAAATVRIVRIAQVSAKKTQANGSDVFPNVVTLLREGKRGSAMHDVDRAHLNLSRPC